MMVVMRSCKPLRGITSFSVFRVKREMCAVALYLAKIRTCPYMVGMTMLKQSMEGVVYLHDHGMSV